MNAAASLQKALESWSAAEKELDPLVAELARLHAILQPVIEEVPFVDGRWSCRFRDGSLAVVAHRGMSFGTVIIARLLVVDGLYTWLDTGDHVDLTLDRACEKLVDFLMRNAGDPDDLADRLRVAIAFASTEGTP